MSETMVTRFNESIDTHRWPGTEIITGEFRIYDFCHEGSHFRCSIPIGEPKNKAWPSCKLTGPCDNSCARGKLMPAKLLTWEAQEAAKIRVALPVGAALVHARTRHNNRPYFRVFRAGSRICPALLETGILLYPGDTTLALRYIKNDEQNCTLVYSIRNYAGETTIEVIATIPVSGETRISV